MNSYKLSCAFLCVLLFTFTSNMAYGRLIIAKALTHDGSQALLQHDNRFENSFASSSDGFQHYQLGVSTAVPQQLVDRSTTSSDSLGIIAENDHQSFFGIADTENPQNSGAVSASWLFIIAGAQNLSVSIDFAAIGNFESNDYFNWQYRIDNQPIQSLFQSSIDEALDYDYQLASGTQVTYEDPMRVEGHTLSNQFLSIDKHIMGWGNQLELVLSAQLNGNDEAVAFRNLFVTGVSAAPAAAIAEPNMLWVFLLGGAAIFFRIKFT